MKVQMQDKKDNEINDLQPVKDAVGEEEKSIVETPKTKAVMGRPKGAKNKDTLFKELMTNNFQDIAKVNIEKTFEVLFKKAHEGDMKAIKLVLDRVVPVTKAVDLADMEKKGLVINISVGNMEDAQVQGEVIEDAEFEEVD